MISEDRIKKMIRLSDYEYGLGEQDIRRTRFGRSDYIHLQVIKTIGCMLASGILIITLVSLYYMEEIRWSALLSLKNLSGGELVLVIAAAIVVAAIFAMSILLCFRFAGRDYDESQARVREYETTLSELLALYEKEREEESV